MSDDDSLGAADDLDLQFRRVRRNRRRARLEDTDDEDVRLPANSSIQNQNFSSSSSSFPVSSLGNLNVPPQINPQPPLQLKRRDLRAKDDGAKAICFLNIRDSFNAGIVPSQQ